MTPPAVAGAYLAYAGLLGLGLGLIYGFLRPLRQKHPHFADGIFLLFAFFAWLYFSFALCNGAIRIGYWVGFLAGGVIWEFTVGRLLRPVFLWFWLRIFTISAMFTGFLGKFFKKIASFGKKLFAYRKKSGTIKSSEKSRRKGGRRHDKEQSGKSHQAGL